MTDLISKDIVDLQDIEKVQFLQTLQADPAKYSAYIQDKSSRILSEVVDTKRASFIKSASDMARMMDMDHNSLATLDRSGDVLTMQDQIIASQESQRGARQANVDLTRRQVEINNWYYENKREKLFLLQIILLTMLTVAIILAGAYYGWLPQDGADYLMLFVIIVGAGTVLYRWYYTNYIRDPRFWSRRVFPGDGKHRPAGELCIGEGSGDQNVDTK